MSEIHVAVIVGSLRKGSYTLKLAKNFMKLAPDNVTMELVEIRDLNLYNADEDDTGDTPQSWIEFRDRIRPFDAVLFATPEYNRSMPGALKNAIDVGSRPYGKSVWDKKPAGIISVSPGMIGAFGANHHLRQSLVFVNVPVMPQPEAYIGGAAKMFDDEDNLTVEPTREFLQKFMNAFVSWIELITKRDQ